MAIRNKTYTRKKKNICLTDCCLFVWQLNPPPSPSFYPPSNKSIKPLCNFTAAPATSVPLQPI